MALDLADKTVNGNTLTNNNSVADVTTGLPTVSGNTDAAGFTAASSQYLSAVQSTTLKPTGNFTVEAWVKTSATNCFIVVNYFENSNPAGFELSIGGTGKLALQSGKNSGTVQGTDYQNITGATTVNDGTWHHVAGVYDGSSLIVYVDGSSDGTQAWTNAPVYNASGNFRIGNRNYAGSEANFTDCTIDEVRIWGMARTASQISSYKGNQLTGFEQNLNAYYPFNKLIVAGGIFLSNFL